MSPPARSLRRSDARRPSRVARATDDNGAALVLVLILTAMLAAAGSSVMLMTDVDVMAAANQRDSAEATYAAESVAEYGVHILATLPDWNRVLQGSAGLIMSGVSTLPPAAGGGPVDLAAQTTDVQRTSYGSGVWGADTPRWRVFGHGIPGRDLPVADMSSDVYAFVWVSDDVTEEDGLADVDGNEMVVVRARAIGRRGSRCDVQVVLARTATPGIVRRISSRIVRAGAE
jgi:hypothetical protein